VSAADALALAPQASFRGQALLQQHLEGPAHRKAEARAEALRLRNERLGANRGAAEAAVVRARPGAQRGGWRAAGGGPLTRRLQRAWPARRDWPRTLLGEGHAAAGL